jgi:hypothetical protein
VNETEQEFSLGYWKKARREEKPENEPKRSTCGKKKKLETFVHRPIQNDKGNRKENVAGELTWKREVLVLLPGSALLAD